MQHVIPKNLCLRNAEEVVRRSQQQRRRIVNNRDESRGVNLLTQHPPPFRLHVILAQRIRCVVLARRDIDRVDNDESQSRPLDQFSRDIVDDQGKVLNFVIARIDKHERAAHVPGCRRCGVEQLAEVVL